MRQFVIVCTLISISFLPACQRQIAPQQAIASAHPLATAAGMQVLDQGGNAFDAAVAVSATLAVVEPYSSGLGGGGFYLLHREKDGKQVFIDAREVAPHAARADMYLDSKGEVIPGKSMDGALAAGIPGVPAALEHLAKNYGELTLKDSLAPAIRTAREGFTASLQYRKAVEFRLKTIQASPAASAVFLQNNAVPESGFRIVQPDLANTLQKIAEQGARGFYQGDIAAKLVQGVTVAGGNWTVEDLQQYTVKERVPVTISYRDYRIISAPPPSSGGVALAQMLNILGQYDLANLDPVPRTHLMIEAMRRAYRDRAEYLGDPDFVKVPVQQLISKEHAEDLAGTISQQHATPNSILPPVSVPAAEGHHTTHFSIIDKFGNRVAATLSINYPFGSGFMPPGTGVLLNDEMDDFVAKAGVPNAYGLVGGTANAIAPGKRMLSSMSPTFVEHKDKIAILGTPGGSRIITMVLQGILGVVDGKSAAEIVEQKRLHHQYLPNLVFYEKDALDAEELADLQLLGHVVQETEQPYGNMQIVVWDKKSKQVTAASDPRGEGSAVSK